MDINDLKIKEVRQILSVFQGANLNVSHEPFAIGRCYNFNTAYHSFVGEVANIKGQFLILKPFGVAGDSEFFRDNIINMNSIQSARPVDCGALGSNVVGKPNMVLKSKTPGDMK